AHRRIERLLERVPSSGAESDEGVIDAFREAMDDDFGTPEAVAVLFDTIREANRRLDAGGEADSLVAAVREIVAVLGLDAGDSTGGLDEEAIKAGAAEVGVEVDDDVEDDIAKLLAVRTDASQARDFATADAVRESLSRVGVVVEDTPDGARWLRA